MLTPPANQFTWLVDISGLVATKAHHRTWPDWSARLNTNPLETLALHQGRVYTECGPADEQIYVDSQKECRQK